MADNSRIEGTTASWRYALLIANYIFEHAKEVKAETLLEYGYPVQDPNELVKIFTGNMRGDVSKAVGLSASATQDGSGLLSAMRCYTLLKSGGRGITSVYLVHYKPTYEQYNEFRQRQGQLTNRIVPSKWEQTLRDMADLRIRVSKLENTVESLQREVNSLGRIGNIIGD